MEQTQERQETNYWVVHVLYLLLRSLRELPKYLALPVCKNLYTSVAVLNIECRSMQVVKNGSDVGILCVFCDDSSECVLDILQPVHI